MTFSEIVGRLGLGTFPTIALVIFLVVFAVVMARLFSRRRSAEYRHLSELPLESDESSDASADSNAGTRP
ncbi:MAG: hypothetical protein KDA22_15325 [Phycisphaerales bacterium]|nr:hypothetical protein [Phycisphaerales bacterium]